MNNKNIKKILCVILLVLVVVFCALGAFHHCDHNINCSICYIINSVVNYISKCEFNVLMFIGAYFVVVKLKFNIFKFSLVEKRVRINS